MTLESEYTQPTPHCPHPERWHAPDAHAAECEVTELVAAFVRALQPDPVVETGTHRGYTAQAIGTALLFNGHGHLHTIEIDPDLHAEAVERTKFAVEDAIRDPLPVTCHLGSSLDWHPPAPIDFAWLDSDTGIRALEYTTYRPHMHERTIIGFHDTAPHHGYRHQLDQLGLTLLDLPTPRGVTFGRIR